MNYTEIVAASKTFADREDNEVNDSIDTFIAMAESRINRILKTREQSVRAFQATIDQAEYYCLPSDYRGMRDIQVNSAEIGTESRQLKFLSPEQMNYYRNKPYAGNNYYTVIAKQLQVYPKFPEGQTIEMVYYQKVPNLNSENDTNWLSIEHPDIYISGIVGEIELFVKNYEVSMGWINRMKDAFSDLVSSDTIERWGTPSMDMRID